MGSSCGERKDLVEEAETTTMTQDRSSRGAFLLSFHQTLSTGQTLKLPELPKVPLLSTGQRPSSSRNSRSPTIVHRTETFLPSESPGNAHRTDRPSSSRKSRYCPPDGDPELHPSPGFWELCGARHRSSSGKSGGGHETSRVCIWTRG